MTNRSRIGPLLAVLLLLAATPSSSEENDVEVEFRPPDGLREGWYAQIETGLGPILIRLLPEQAPQSVAHFVDLARGEIDWLDPATGESTKTPYYDGVAVHRAVAGQNFEIGDRTGTGRGAPQIYVPPNEGMGPINFDQGYRVGNTRETGQRMSAPQIFITAAPSPWLSGKHPCFGEVISGQTNVFNIAQVKTYSSGKPIKPVIIERVRIFTVGDPSPLAEPVPYKPQIRSLSRPEG